ncbi:hypothetical protein K443DRAFT_679704 [Laccaria amethystina LaAM-08-1]|uniref:Uncharacterized protein n=1 Tax=Laccaria amethystina LaAM-08-1 TaxID=1095629 RepID=A0A0C9XUW9_9AGAR|nr:hypothetical protein K443DRAFT_679704 [Laccaria amethystina LaAM-08-1]
MSTASTGSLLLGPRPLPVFFANKLLLACAYALDPLCNRQQMEYPWYSFWTIVLLDLIAGLPEYILFPQYPVWIIPPEESDDADYESDVEPASEPFPCLNFDPNTDQPDAVESHASSSQSSQSPQSTPPPPGRANKFKLPDFAVLGLFSGTIGEVDFHSLSEALQYLRSRRIINNVLTPLIVEIKRDSLILTDRYVTQAQADAERQAAFIFASSHQRFVVAIVTAGVQWSWAVIRRPAHLPVASAEEQGDSTYVPRELNLPNVAWSDVLDFGSADSDTALRKVSEWMMGLRRGRRLNDWFKDGATNNEDEATSDSDDIQDSGVSRSNLEDDAGGETETEGDRRQLTPSGHIRQSYAGPRALRLWAPPTDSPDPLDDYFVGRSHAGLHTPGTRALIASGSPTDSPDPLDDYTQVLPTTPSGKNTAKRNRATDSPKEAVASLSMPPTCQVSPSSKPLRKRGKMHATTSSQPM